MKKTSDRLAAALLDYFRSPEYVESAKKFAGEWLQASSPEERYALASEDSERIARELAEHLAKIPGLRIEELPKWKQLPKALNMTAPSNLTADERALWEDATNELENADLTSAIPPLLTEIDRLRGALAAARAGFLAIETIEMIPDKMRELAKLAAAEASEAFGGTETMSGPEDNPADDVQPTRELK